MRSCKIIAPALPELRPFKVSRASMDSLKGTVYFSLSSSLLSLSLQRQFISTKLRVYGRRNRLLLERKAIRPTTFTATTGRAPSFIKKHITYIHTYIHENNIHTHTHIQRKTNTQKPTHTNSRTQTHANQPAQPNTLRQSPNTEHQFFSSLARRSGWQRCSASQSLFGNYLAPRVQKLNKKGRGGNCVMDDAPCCARRGSTVGDGRATCTSARSPRPTWCLLFLLIPGDGPML